MKKSTRHKLQNTALALFSFYLLLSPIPFNLNPTRAQTASPSAIVESKPLDSLKEKIEDLKAEIASRAATIKQEVNKKVQNRLFMGTLQQLDGSTITITKDNTTLKIVTNEFTEYKDNTGKKGKAKLTIKNLAKDDYIIALGDIDDSNNLAAKRIIINNKPNLSEKKIYNGSVEEINGNNIKLKVTQDNTVDLEVDKNTKYNLGPDTGVLTDIKQGMSITTLKEASEGAKVQYIYISDNN